MRNQPRLVEKLKQTFHCGAAGNAAKQLHPGATVSPPGGHGAW